MEKITEFERILPKISNTDFNQAQKNLMDNMTQKSFFREKQFIIYESETISEDFTNDNLRRSYYTGCELKKVNLSNVGMSGSVFINTSFLDCILNNTKLDFCEFDKCTWKNQDNNQILYTNFNKSLILDSQFLDTKLKAVNFTDVILENVLFENCTWTSLSLEGTIFNNTTLRDVKLKKLNFEFSYFKNITLDNVRLPFPTIPYIYNGLNYLINTKDNVCISSANNNERKISKEEYLNYLDDMIVFYTKTQNYFPLANIFIALGNYEKAYAAIILGIKFSMVHIRNFRLVYYFCKLLQLTKEFSTSQLSYAYDVIIKNSNLKGWRQQDSYNFSYYIDSIRNVLLNEKASNFLVFTLYTNIKCNEFLKIATLYEIIETFLRKIEKVKHTKITHYIEIRHNSPHEFFIKFFSDPDILGVVLEGLQMVFMGVGKLISIRKERQQQIKENEEEKRKQEQIELDNAVKQAELEYYKVRTENLILENQKLQEESKQLHDILTQNHIIIHNYNYHFFDNLI